MPKQKLEIDRTLVCTTAHLTAEDNQALFDDATNLSVYEMGEYGWLVLARRIEGIPCNHSANLEKVLAFARKNQCDWVRFDRDAETIEGLETFNW